MLGSRGCRVWASKMGCAGVASAGVYTVALCEARNGFSSWLAFGSMCMKMYPKPYGPSWKTERYCV